MSKESVIIKDKSPVVVPGLGTVSSAGFLVVGIDADKKEYILADYFTLKAAEMLKEEIEEGIKCGRTIAEYAEAYKVFLDSSGIKNR